MSRIRLSWTDRIPGHVRADALVGEDVPIRVFFAAEMHGWTPKKWRAGPAGTMAQVTVWRWLCDLV